MKKIILTAVDNNHRFWFDQLVPFLLSLKRTNYDGDIGIICYGLSENKKRVLAEQGIILIDAPNIYKTIYIDRQWAAATIAEQLNYDYVALYDTDIWFPSANFTLFSELKHQDKLYCAYDHSYGKFIENCVKEEYREHIRTLMQQHYLPIHHKPWQVGVIAGQKQAWVNYKKYLEQQLNNEHIFTQEYGIDTLLICLYSLEKNNILELSPKYNCLPVNGGLLYSNISADGSILANEEFRINDELVQGLHIVGPFRLYDRNFYEYAKHNGLDYFNEGKKFRLTKTDFNEIDVSSFQSLVNKNVLQIIKIASEVPVKLYRENNDLKFEVGAKTHIYLKNISGAKIAFVFAIELMFGHKVPKGRFVAYNNDMPSITVINEWQAIVLEPNAEVVLACYDIDNESRLIWRIKGMAQK